MGVAAEYGEVGVGQGAALTVKRIAVAVLTLLEPEWQQDTIFRNGESGGSRGMWWLEGGCGGSVG
jgi:hypothetical protein